MDELDRSDRDELETEVQRAKAWYFEHLRNCPVCAAALAAAIDMYEFDGCPVMPDFREHRDQAQNRLDARNALEMALHDPDPLEREAQRAENRYYGHLLECPICSATLAAGLDTAEFTDAW
jgi:DNA-binding helix-hairpin-helix protein with protein kinase domain